MSYPMFLSSGVELRTQQGPTGPQGYTGPQGPIGKTFVIQHPNDKEKYLVHGCLEGPEVGVYYRGKCSIKNNLNVKITLPNYVSNISNDFTIQVTPIYNENNVENNNLAVSEINDNSFIVYGLNTDFFWSVYGKRISINTEPDINDVILKGSGPYTWIEKKK